MQAFEMKVLELAPGDVVLVNGTLIKRTEDGTLQVPSSAKILTRKDMILDGAEATTVAKRIFFVLQAMSLDPANADRYEADLTALVDTRAEKSELVPILKSLGLIIDFARRGDYASSLEICRHLVEFDEALTREFPALETV